MGGSKEKGFQMTPRLLDRPPPRYRVEARRRRVTPPSWQRLSDEELLRLRLRDLDLTIKGTPIEDRVGQLYDELGQRGIRFRPPVWLSDEWFVPEHVPGIAIPFYLAHPRLTRLEARQMFEVEGGNKTWCMQLLRHEAGHAIETAYHLHRKRKWRRIFGRASKRYPDCYTPKPKSRDYVLHLDWWYAQSHPSEDFAETFAVWLKPGSAWRRRYRNWPAIHKLEYVDELMAEIAGKRAPIDPAPHIDPLHRLRHTLRTHYRRKRGKYLPDDRHYYDRRLLRLFSRSGGQSAAAFLAREAASVRRQVAGFDFEKIYVTNLVLKELTKRSRELDLRVARTAREIRPELADLVDRMQAEFHRDEHVVPV